VAVIKRVMGKKMLKHARTAMILLFAFLGLFIAGAYTALAPQLVARLLLLPILLFLILLALLSQSNADLSEKTLKYWLGLLLTTMALWPTYMIIKVGGLPSVDARRVVAGLSIAVTIYLIFSRKPIRESFFLIFKGPLGVTSFLLSIYVALRVTSSLVSEYSIYSLLQVFWEILYYYSMFFIAAILFYKKHLQEWALKIMLVLALIVSFYSAIEWVLQKNILVMFTPSGKEFAMFQKALAVERLRDGFFRAQGTFEHPLLLAEFSAMAASFGVSALMWKNQNKSIRQLGFFAFLSAVFAGFLTGSRSAFVALGVSIIFLVLVWLFANKSFIEKGNSAVRKFFCVTTFLSILLIALPVLNTLVSGKNVGEAASTNSRLYMMELGWRSIKNNFLLGTGPGSSGSIAGVVNASGVGTLDNYFLAIAIESGVPALVFLMLFLTYPIWILFNKLIDGDLTIDKAFSSAVMGCLIVTTLVHAILWMPYNMFFVFLLTGMALASISKQS
jgi:O-antigen ligase